MSNISKTCSGCGDVVEIQTDKLTDLRCQLCGSGEISFERNAKLKTTEDSKEPWINVTEKENFFSGRPTSASIKNYIWIVSSKKPFFIKKKEV